jgi:hypothetical protein
MQVAMDTNIEEDQTNTIYNTSRTRPKRDAFEPTTRVTAQSRCAAAPATACCLRRPSLRHSSSLFADFA